MALRFRLFFLLTQIINLLLWNEHKKKMFIDYEIRFLSYLCKNCTKCKRLITLTLIKPYAIFFFLSLIFVGVVYLCCVCLCRITSKWIKKEPPAKSEKGEREKGKGQQQQQHQLQKQILLEFIEACLFETNKERHCRYKAGHSRKKRQCLNWMPIPDHCYYACSNETLKLPE